MVQDPQCPIRHDRCNSIAEVLDPWLVEDASFLGQFGLNLSVGSLILTQFLLFLGRRVFCRRQRMTPRRVGCREMATVVGKPIRIGRPHSLILGLRQVLSRHWKECGPLLDAAGLLGFSDCRRKSHDCNHTLCHDNPGDHPTKPMVRVLRVEVRYICLVYRTQQQTDSVDTEEGELDR